jgi:ribosomal protein RSM22 (predicted rRNA methylase)
MIIIIIGRLERIVVSARRGKKDFRQLRERAWGDLFPPDTFTIEDDINENNENNNNDSNNSFDTKHNNF